PAYTWQMPAGQKKIYLSFDDGPHPEATPFVLDTLRRYDAKATFFCIGKNVLQYPELYKRILLDGHATGNHTHNHLNGWKTPDKEYLGNIQEASQYIDSKLFRPPYGRISRFQALQVQEQMGLRVVMWSVLSGDFDTSLSPQKCTENVQKSATGGSIVVFHDSEKAMPRLTYALPKVLEYFTALGYHFEKLPG
ncbi:MAG: polysaccharide deacetylase family protein, partial [Bacteroidetes bacterium]|nr:polysaccharide deacetylase family protein [Bacteroidota bacterium]